MTEDSIRNDLKLVVQHIEQGDRDSAEEYCMTLIEDLQPLLRPGEDHSKTGTRSGNPVSVSSSAAGFGLGRLRLVVSRLEEVQRSLEGGDMRSALNSAKQAVSEWATRP
jgi:hypothetical protein